ncbi:hypothetical protein DCO58_07005 [Helicobacter saguini]|uniref:Uncharacterized protein n=1 Tax=Helicobacter saguini TaxID=1548018 RepID=A0A347VN35_9HELI|nr:hypothetical protein [Helicobacter saguini]MWV61918.1 hypothetical protein [Helicobacter saguini]MWV67407.1 hypothetical protein [Helicobacter saguini]MWV69760.1 hypothetical protein [Helicobacter saguini]MWV73023.1 hypothetical protein [Helicobacter saguini]TLD95600.1 hypothetical protein LS64_001730 [Helicobacter saguini]
MLKYLLILLTFLGVVSAENYAKYADMISKRESFFTEAFAQTYDTTKINLDSKSGLEFIDFCSFPPDRSLVFGPLQNGRFHGQKVGDLPFTCNNNSGSKKIFIKNANITQSYHIIRANFSQFLLSENMPQKTSSETFNINGKQNTLHYIFQNFDTKKQEYIVNERANDRFWIIYSGGISRYVLIFTQKGSNTEVIMQYLNL